jgi:hypothetical protein
VKPGQTHQNDEDNEVAVLMRLLWRLVLLLTGSAFFADLITGNGPLPGAPEAQRIFAAELCVLGFASADPGPPHSKTGALHLPPHEGYDLCLRQAELQLNGLKRGAVFPCHFYDAVYVLLRHIEVVLCRCDAKIGGETQKRGDGFLKAG